MTTNVTITDLGDVHLGRKFTTGVPLHRMGDREAMVWEQFVSSLMNCTTTFHIQTGDLFEAFAMPEALVLDTARAYEEAARQNPDTMYVVYRGNHDASRDTTKKSSFDVFAELVFGIENLWVFRHVNILRYQGATIGVIPWDPFKSAEELALELKALHAVDPNPLDMVYGHWDTQSFGNSTFNLIPTHILKDITKVVKTGHIHKPTTFKADGVDVIVVGSMQPYAHGEDPHDQLYQTIKYDQLASILPSDLEDVNVRVLVESGQVVPDIPGVYSLITKVVKPGAMENDEESMQVEFEEFDMKALFQDCLKNNKVGTEIAAIITEKFEELKNV